MKNYFSRISLARGIYLLLASIYAFCIIAQVFIAGMALFIQPIHWIHHVNFVHYFGFNIPVLLFLLAWIGAFPRWAYWHLFGLLSLMFAMYFTANITGKLPLGAATHPLLAVLLVLLSCFHVYKVLQLNLKKMKGAH
ncbi:DUF6220 domain-containing protein [Sutcliffiella halmapala]|uniref:DUF6220 domain-containing protein n=1 Tax=Sutcliffiella halmapala TaxID=79882 RepID=UPI000994EC59|nr:DUF6220 domain-containing protein [Sutcliffiella halmapala]